MKNSINYVLSLKRYTKSLLLITLLVLLFPNIYSQTNLPKRAKLKTIMYSDYAISGYVYKKEFVEGQKLTFFARPNSNKIVLSGRYFYDDNRNSYIEGTRIQRGNLINNRTNGIFKVTNTKNERGITTNKKEAHELVIQLEDLKYYQDNLYYIGDHAGYGNLILQKLPNNKYSLKIKYKVLVLETIIPYSKDLVGRSEYTKEILNSNTVKLSFTNGDVFDGKVKSTSKLPAYCDFYYTYVPYAPDSGEYRYASGEISTGIFNCDNYFERFYLEKGVTVFTDGSKINGDWVFEQNLNSSEQKKIYSKDRTPTEFHNMAKSIIEEKNKKLIEEKAAKEQAEKEKLQQQQLWRSKLIEKYGEYYGNKISDGQLSIGMSQEMVNELWPKIFFNISIINRTNNQTVIWKFDKNKMQREIIKKAKENGNEDGAAALIIMFNLSEQLGGLDSPKMLVFKNNKLTDIYR